jgi:hypothetical protein
MVQAVRNGASYRAAARKWQVSLRTVARWMERARGRQLSAVDWRDRPSGTPRPSGRTPPELVRAIARARRRLQRHDALGEHGPEAIRRDLLARGLAAPCARTIARWLVRLGLSGRERWRRPPPPKGWYLPEVRTGRAEVDSCDIVEGLRLRGGPRVEALNTLALWGGTVDTTAATRISTQTAIAALQTRWQCHGRPDFLQCDNDTVFTGAHAQRAYLGRLVHWCLCVGVVPVFTPPAELGFQASIEAYNRRWQDRVWRRWRHPSLRSLQQRSTAFVAAYTARAQRSRATQPVARHPWCPPGREPRIHRIVLLRRLNCSGALLLCAQHLPVTAAWANRLVRCEVNVQRQSVRIYGLRRRDPFHQPFLTQLPLQLPLVPWHRPVSP